MCVAFLLLIASFAKHDRTLNEQDFLNSSFITKSFYKPFSSREGGIHPATSYGTAS